MSQKKVIIDTDPGIDDSLAILLALASPELAVQALTVVSGNCHVDQGIKNAIGILELAGRPDIPVLRGAERPLIQPLLVAPETHGLTGLGYAILPEPQTPPAGQNAVEFLIQEFLAHPGELPLVCLGPLTNLALAIRLAPQIVAAIPEVIIMGGAIRHEGNTTPLAEFNTYCDPHAAHIVFHSGLPITLIPLDVTYEVILTRADVDLLLEFPSPISAFVADATRFYMEFHDEYQEIEGCIINDPLALVSVFSSQFVETMDLFVDVDLSGGVSMAKTFADFYRMGSQPANMQVALKVHPRPFIEFFLDRVGRLCRAFPAERRRNFNDFS